MQCLVGGPWFDLGSFLSSLFKLLGNTLLYSLNFPYWFLHHLRQLHCFQSATLVCSLFLEPRRLKRANKICRCSCFWSCSVLCHLVQWRWTKRRMHVILNSPWQFPSKIYFLAHIYLIWCTMWPKLVIQQCEMSHFYMRVHCLRCDQSEHKVHQHCWHHYQHDFALEGCATGFHRACLCRTSYPVPRCHDRFACTIPLPWTFQPVLVRCTGPKEHGEGQTRIP